MDLGILRGGSVDLDILRGGSVDLGNLRGGQWTSEVLTAVLPASNLKELLLPNGLQLQLRGHLGPALPENGRHLRSVHVNMYV